MNQEYRIVYVEKPEESAWGIIGQGLHNYNVQHAGDTNFQRLCFILQADDETIAGGVLGEIHWDWLYIDLMWVSESQRGCGHGQRLLEAIEEEARQRGAKNVYLDTFSFQAPDFYKKHGYIVFGELKNFPAGHQRFFLTKQL
jgi:GNAT superfamily N-acetyltransferase